MLNRGDLPAGYKKLEYLESTGTQYILAENISIDTNDFYSYKSQLLSSDRVAGIWGTVSNNLRSYIFNENNLYGISFGAATNYKLSLNASYQLLKIELNKDELLVNGIRHTSAASIEYIKTDKLYLFNQFVNNQFWPSDVRFYYFTVEGKHNFIPVLDPTGAPCMFDTVTRTPFYNAGTGDFLYPGKETTATTYSLRRPRMYAQMTRHGIRRLYHVPRGYNGTPEEYAEQNGFKLLVETPQPEEGYWLPVWHEREDCIELEWVETEPPVNEEENI